MRVSVELWQQCVELLRDELPAQQFNTWIRPLQVESLDDELRVYAPNRFVLDWVNDKYLGRLVELLLFAGAIYFVICFSASQLVKRLQARFVK